MPLALNGTTGIVTGNLADGSVTTPKIADSAVGTADIADSAVTAAKLNGAQSGSAPIYGCRAWVNFDGTRDSTGAASTANTNRLIRASGNVASVLRNTIGDYTITFTTEMPDANYAAVTAGSYSSASGCLAINHSTAPTASAVRLIHGHLAGNGATGYPSDPTYGMVSIFR